MKQNIDAYKRDDSKRVSEQAVQSSWNVAAGASATASLACVPAWHEDFRDNLSRIDVSRWLFTAMRTAFCRSLPQDFRPRS